MSLTAGFGRADLTPPLGVELAGYGYFINRRAAKVRDRLYARALALSEGDVKALIVSCDLLGLSREIVREVKDCANALGFEDDAVTIVSVHTHTGPCTIYHLGCGELSPAYVSTVAGTIKCAVEAAARDLRPVRSLQTGLSPLPEGFAYNRAIEGAPVDRFVRGALLEREGAPDIALVSFACHGVSLGRVPCVSADFSGEVHRLLGGRGIQSIYVNGLCGDIDPVAPEDTGAREPVMRAFAAEIERAFVRGLRPVPVSLRSGTVPFSLRVQTFTPDQIRQEANAAVERCGDAALPAARVARIWEAYMLARGEQPDHEDYAFPYIRLGDMTVVSFPFEGYTRTGALVRETAGDDKIITLGCAEQLMGYLPTREDIERQSYGALESAFLYQCTPAMPGEAERLGEAVGGALKRVMGS